MKPLRPIVPLTLLMAVSPVAQQGAPPPAAQGQEQPRFRGGANLVRLDAYVTVGGEPVTDLTAQDFEVLEDNVPQKVESFEHIRPRRPAAQAERLEPNTVSESRTMASDPSARLFVLFLDTFHVPLAGSFHARKPLVQFLDRAIGQDDMVGMMTAEMSARNLTLARRTETIEGILTDNWYWGKRDRIATKTEREQALEMCYPDLGATAGIATRTNLGNATTDTTISFTLAEDPSAPYLIMTARGPLSGPAFSATRGSAKDPPGMVNIMSGIKKAPSLLPDISIPTPHIPNPFK